MATEPIITLNYNRPAAHPTIVTPIDMTLSADVGGTAPAMFTILSAKFPWVHHDIFVIDDEIFQFVNPATSLTVTDNRYVAIHLDPLDDLTGVFSKIARVLGGVNDTFWDPFFAGPGFPTTPSAGFAKLRSKRFLRCFPEAFDFSGAGDFLAWIHCFNAKVQPGNGPFPLQGGADQMPDSVAGNNQMKFYPFQSLLNSGQVYYGGAMTVPISFVDGTVSILINADADERSDNSLQGPLFRADLTPDLDADGNAALNTLITPILGTGTDAPEPGPTLIYVPHPENMDVWQTERGRPRQDYVNVIGDDDLLLIHGEEF